MTVTCLFLSTRYNIKNMVQPLKQPAVLVIQWAPHFLCYFFEKKKLHTFLSKLYNTHSKRDDILTKAHSYFYKHVVRGQMREKE